MHFVAGATLATTVLLLSIRSRKSEIETMIKIGASRASVASILSLEIGIVVVAGLLLAGALTAISASHAPELLRTLILS